MSRRKRDAALSRTPSFAAAADGFDTHAWSMALIAAPSGLIWLPAAATARTSGTRARMATSIIRR